MTRDEFVELVAETLYRADGLLAHSPRGEASRRVLRYYEMLASAIADTLYPRWEAMQRQLVPGCRPTESNECPVCKGGDAADFKRLRLAYETAMAARG